MMPQFIVSVITMVIAANLMLLACAYLIFLERKVAAWAQDRIGPNRTNFSFGILPFRGKQGGLGQALADGLKLFFKEDYSPPHVDKGLFILAPMMVMIPALIGWAVIPWGGYLRVPFTDGVITSVAVAPINVALVYLLAVSSLAVYGVVVGAYASNNKYSFLGGVRATAQMVSYEIPQSLCVLVMILTFSTTDAGIMSNLQAGLGAGGIWGIFIHPLLAVIFFVCVLAECNRAPFDLAEAEQELIGGFHTEYGSMKWAMFFLGEYMNMITGSAFFCILFLGGWDLIPFAGALPVVGGVGIAIAKIAIFVVKVAICLFIMMWVRWTLPRFRFDQLMRLAWTGLIPITLTVLLISGVIIFLNFDRWWVTAGLMGVADIGVAIVATAIAPLLPQGAAVNHRIPLAGSRYSPLHKA